MAEQKLESAFFECFKNLRIAEFIGEDYRTELAKESVAYAIKNAEKEYYKAIKEAFTTRESELQAEVKTIRTGYSNAVKDFREYAQKCSELQAEAERLRDFIGTVSNLGPSPNKKLEHANQILADLRSGAKQALSQED